MYKTCSKHCPIKLSKNNIKGSNRLFFSTNYQKPYNVQKKNQKLQFKVKLLQLVTTTTNTNQINHCYVNLIEITFGSLRIIQY